MELSILNSVSHAMADAALQYRQVGVIAGKGPGPDQFSEALRGLAVGRDDGLYAVGDAVVRVFASDGALRRHWQTSAPAHSVALAADGTVYVGQAGIVEVFDGQGQLLEAWRDPEHFGRVTAIGLLGDMVLIGDAKGRCIRCCDRHGTVQRTIGSDNRRKGFIIPNGVVDFDVDEAGIIHATNPGKHRVERYSAEGQLLGHIGRFDGRDPAGFAGCCNPTNVAIQAGRVYVTEKAGPRAKVYDFAGTLLAVIASDVFDPNCKNMDVDVDSQGRVYVVDTVRCHVVVFAPVGNPPAEGRSIPESTGATRP